MLPSAEIIPIIYMLLIQLATGMVIACQFAPGPRKFVRRQFFFALCFLAVAPFCNLFIDSGLRHSSYWTRNEIYCLSALGVGLIAAFWLRYSPDERAFERILNWLLAILSLCLLYSQSRIYNISITSGWQANTVFFLFLASALILGSIWLAMFAARIANSEAAPLRLSAIYGRLFFLALSGLVLAAIFTPFALPTASQPSSATRMSIADWHAWHNGLSGFACLTFLVAIYQNWLGEEKPAKRIKNEIIPGLPTLGFAFIFALLGEAAGRIGFLLGFPLL